MAKEKPVNPHEPILSTEVHWRAPTAQDMALDDHGRELLSPLPLSPPIGYQKQKTLAETMREMIRSEALKQAALAAGAETFEEADDFDVGDDYDPSSPWEWEDQDEIPGSPNPLPVPPSGGPEAPPEAAKPLTATTPPESAPPPPSGGLIAPK